MNIEKISIVGFRNFSNATVKFNESTLIIGANDVGKTNMIYALRLLLDKSLSERDIEPQITDFHIAKNGSQVSQFTITIFFKDIIEDAVLSILKGNVSDDGCSVLKLMADRGALDYKLLIGSNEIELEEVTSRFYLKYINMRYVKSRRDLKKFIESEKKQLLKISQDNRDTQKAESDERQLGKISRGLNVINERVSKLNYVKDSTLLVNNELKKLSYGYNDYAVHLDSGAIKVHQFIDNLELGASISGSKMMLGGEGRDNQILLALWKAKSEREFDPDHEVTFYCVEEPEAHLHPHQQRKLADYLNKELPGQSIITSHSPQITARYKPDSIVRIINKDGASYAASEGCSNCISTAWDELGYRISILPAEAFFSSCVFLVEGPSEQLFYQQLAIAANIDLDYYNISILSVDGIAFNVYTNILNALEIPWVLRTDNDVSKVPNNDLKNLAGINRCMDIAGLSKLPHRDLATDANTLVQDGTWLMVSNQINPLKIYLSKIDLESDLSLELSGELLAYSGKTDMDEAIKYLQDQKAIRMREFLAGNKDNLANIQSGELIKPLLHAQKIVEMSL
ncbi:ATP-dependent nuclease [Methylomonas koyamae]|uniref:ATP-dependent nuclease n=1 Tax=Methylomonas koyamae TaxID=702114 RepID=UPI0006D23F6B|nr:AAA family ATPase [Methylomonas koyamae]BBL57403.1 ATP-dependent endonuclease [Methylomonas koyamae]